MYIPIQSVNIPDKYRLYANQQDMELLAGDKQIIIYYQLVVSNFIAWEF
jgi:hypothetical protein